ncbi:MAG: hypothetical protein E3J75_02750 [Dehalococcoidia bacterium]|nr:MAG: hypothetical protein E3J75_02750 [Dehalococcoidia bacterium]
MNILEGNVRLFHEGNASVYRVIAGQLWLLLCDGKNSLVSRVFQNVKLHPLLGYITKEEDEEWKRKFGHSIKEGLVFQMPGMVSFNGKGGSRIEVLFDEQRQPMELEEWLDQDLFNQKITIRQLIKSVRHKEAAHSNKDYDETLKFTKSIKLVSEDIHIKFIIAIGEYVLKLLKMAFRSREEGLSEYLS